MNDTFLKACRGEKTDYTPIWIMRQAGRYLPEYQKVRRKLSFLELCKTPELCVEVTLQPVDRFKMDAAILFSDILIPMQAMGAPLEFHEGKGPVFTETVRSREDLDKLIIADPLEKTGFVMETIRLLRQELHVPLIGFAGARVIKQTIGEDLPEGFQRAEFLKEKGFVDRVVERTDMKEELTKILEFFV